MITKGPQIAIWLGLGITVSQRVQFDFLFSLSGHGQKPGSDKLTTKPRNMIFNNIIICFLIVEKKYYQSIAPFIAQDKLPLLSTAK